MLDATVGGLAANSYVTLVEADAYFEDRAYASSNWNSFAEQESLLITCSRMLDWYLKWKGIKTYTEQAMDWPRTGAIRSSGVTINSLIIPSELKTAVFELAVSSFESDRTEDDPLSGISQLKVSSLMIKAGPEKPNNTNRKAVPEKVKKILKDLITQNGSVVWLQRA